MPKAIKILSIGIDPFLIDFTLPEYAAFPGLNAEKVAAGIESSMKQLRELGYDADKCWIDFGETAIDVVSERLDNNDYACVLIGAGIRKPDANFLMFENLVNLIHSKAPKTKICFNNAPHDVVTAIQRWVKP